MESERPCFMDRALFGEQLDTLSNLFSKAALSAVLVTVHDKALTTTQKLPYLVKEEVLGPGLPVLHFFVQRKAIVGV
jgi:hypothetical protein